MEDSGHRLVIGSGGGVTKPRCLLGPACGVISLTVCLVTLVLLAPETGAAGVKAVAVEAGESPATAGVRPAETTALPTVHDLHLGYGDMAVEGSLIAGRIRLFKDDLEKALGQLVGAPTVTLEPGPEADALVMRYLRDHLRVSVDGQRLEASFVGSGEDELDLEPVWWVIVQFRATAPVEELHVENTLLFDVYDDQRNVFKFVHFPDETQRTFYFAEGESEHVVRF